MSRVVTIDGPAGAGKSTVARRLAEKLGWRFLDTGAMYRAVTLAALRGGIDLRCDEALGKLADRLVVRLHNGRVLLDQEDVTTAIRSESVTDSAVFVADSPSVRHRLVEWQRAFAAVADTVNEGRDQGTIVFPGAFRKFFLIAGEEERARRRFAELLARGEPSSFEQVLAAQRVRDQRDAARYIAPMKPADDAMVVNTSAMTIEEVVEELASRVIAELR